MTAGFGGRVALTDNMIHQQDIRRRWYAPRTIPPDGFGWRWISPLLADDQGSVGTPWLRLVATDLDWSHGDGPEVGGAGEALLMAMAGRKDALKDLSGPGKDNLAARM